MKRSSARGVAAGRKSVAGPHHRTEYSLSLPDMLSSRRLLSISVPCCHSLSLSLIRLYISFRLISFLFPPFFQTRTLLSLAALFFLFFFVGATNENGPR